MRNSELELRKIFDQKASSNRSASALLTKNQIHEVFSDLHPCVSTGDIDEMLKAFDLNESEGLHWEDFKKLVNQPTAVEQWTSGIPFSRLLASAIPARNLDEVDLIDENEGLRNICQTLLLGTERLLREHIQSFKKARALMMKSKGKRSNVSSKFSVLSCGTIDDFHAGLENRIGNSSQLVSAILK